MHMCAYGVAPSTGHSLELQRWSSQYLGAVEAYEVALMLDPDSGALIRGRRQSSFAIAVEQ